MAVVLYGLGKMVLARAERNRGVPLIDRVGERGLVGREIVGESGVRGRGGIVSQGGRLM